MRMGMEPDPEKQALDELIEFARGGMAEEMRARHGKPSPEAALEELPEGELGQGMGGMDMAGMHAGGGGDIPGVEPDAGAEGGGAEGGGTELELKAKGDLDPELLRAIIEKLKAGSTG